MTNYYQKEDKTEFFKTPDWIVKKCYEMIPNPKTILDPCAGDCGLEDNILDIRYIPALVNDIRKVHSLF